jgi:hypothetical protein
LDKCSADRGRFVDWYGVLRFMSPSRPGEALQATAGVTDVISFRVAVHAVSKAVVRQCGNLQLGRVLTLVQSLLALAAHKNRCG